MHYLITGGAGFIGSHLALRLKKNNCSVTVLDLPTAKNNAIKESWEGIKLVPGSVTDRELVSRLVPKADRVIHLASVVGVRKAMLHGHDCLKVSTTGTDNILSAAARDNKEVFVASSSAIYGKTPQIPVSEEDESLLGPSSKACWLYSVSKLAEEHLAWSYYREKNIPIKIGRFFNVIGPYQNPEYGMVVPTFVQQALAKKNITVFGDGSQTRTFIDIEDALDALEIILEKGSMGEIYNIGGDREITIIELAEKIKELIASSSPITLIPYHEAFDAQFEETRRRSPDITKIKKLGFSPNHTLTHTLSKIIRNYSS